ncbi:MAG: S8/S53 family peptidase [Chloroflexales bacterium]|nr:S8/S53 family peptidase [Chloroflexales bacterium]
MQRSRRNPIGFIQTVWAFMSLFGRLLQRQMYLSHNAQPQQIRHFVPGQLLLLGEHSDQLDKAAIIQALKNHSIIQCHQELADALQKPPRKLLSFHRNRQESQQAASTTNQNPSFSLIFIDVPITEQDQLIDLIDKVNQDILAATNQEGPLNLHIISPNWLASTAGSIGVVGGPGTRPIPAPAMPPDWQQTPVDAPGAPFGFELNMPVIEPTSPPEQIEVAILDTAPPGDNIKKAYNAWQSKHPLIKSLLGPDGTLGMNSTLEIAYAPGPILDRYAVSGHTYQMFDHGLFAAGIIHTLAPTVKLRLIEVLNHYGVGSIETAIDALQQLNMREAGQPPLIVNCSLMLNIPLEGQPKPELDWPSLNEDSRLVKRMGNTVKWITDLLRERNVLFVAAAGNDAEAGMERPQARYPAAFEDVVGVGALHPDGVPADYSNISDTPLSIGIATFGGKASGDDSVPNEAVRGIYTGLFPNGEQNHDGWAWWSGTSFATPIISGVLAALCHQGASPQEAWEALSASVEDPSGPTMIGRVFQAQQNSLSS